MSTPDCTEARRALMAGDADGADPAHVRECAACAAFAARLTTVDAALDEDAARAAGAGLPDALRARILAAARPHVTTAAPNGRLLDLGLRFAAAAAVLAAAVFALPESARAAEIDFSLDVWRSRLSAVLVEGPEMRLPTAAPTVPLPEPSNPVPLAAGALVLVGAGVFTLRRDAR